MDVQQLAEHVAKNNAITLGLQGMPSTYFESEQLRASAVTKATGAATDVLLCDAWLTFCVLAGVH